MEIPFLIQEVISAMEKIEREVHSMPKAHIPPQAKRGLQVSKTASQQPQLVEMTPLFKNALHKMGFPEGKKLMVYDKETGAERWFKNSMEILLTKYNGKKEKGYNENLPVDSVQHYNQQCWDNFKENMRDIQPGQADEREKAAQEYGVETSSKEIYHLLKSDVVFQKAVLVILELLPSVRASEDFLEINLPFMSKHTNVNSPYWAKDNALAPNGQTYAQLTMDEARRITNPRELYRYNLSTMYGRNQRGKGRLIIAVSRIINLWLNRLEAKEIESYRNKCSLFVGYGDDNAERVALKQMVEVCKKHGFKMRNMDQSRYDRHVSLGFILLLGAISMIKANGQRSKDIAFYRAVLMSKTWLVDGLSGKIFEIYGRIFSGFIDTNRGGGIINAIITTYTLMKQDPNYSSYIYEFAYYMLVMGDDNCFIYKILDKDKMIKDMKNLGFEVNPDKDEYGAMFLQYRLFEDPTSHDLVMAYPWTRVVRSMLFKETGKGLGPAGWTLAFWQQLSKLIEYPEALKIAVNLIIPFDEEKLMLDRPISEIIALVQKEDRDKLEEARTSQQKQRVVSTTDKLYDGDPSKSRFHNSLINNDSDGYLSNLQQAIKSAVDTNFLASAGISVPNRK